MPQMKPMNWLLLIFYFLMLYLLMNVFLYFFYTKNYFMINENFNKNFFNQFNLKW